MSMQALRERKHEIARLANHLLAEKGSQTWTTEDQGVFNGHMEEAERLDTQIGAHQRMLDDRAEKTFSDVTKVTKDGPKDEMRKGLDVFLRKSMKDMTPEDIGAFRNTMSTTTGSQGGYTVQVDVAREFIDLMKDYGGMRRVADRIVTSMGNELDFPTTDGRAEVGELIAQNTAATSADAAFGTVQLIPYKFSSKIITVPIELLQDSQIDVTALVQKRMRDRIGRSENIFFSTGSGSLQPFGLTTTATVGVIGATGSTVTVNFPSLVGMVESIDYAYQSEGALQWLLSQSMRKVVRTLTDGAGRPIFLPGYGTLAQPIPDNLMGFQLAINNDLPAPGANAKSMAFGQFKKFLIRDAMEVTLFRFDDSVYMSKGQVGFLAWARAGSNQLDSAAISLYQHSAT